MRHYTYEQLSSHLYRIVDAFGVAMYLAVGEREACLVDTGYGLTGLRELVETITPLPVTVLLTHGHVDHALGIYEFDKVYLNPADRETFAFHSLPVVRETLTKQLPPEFPLGELTFQKARGIELLPVADGQVFDLGGLHIRAVHTPGHTPGMTMYLFEEYRLMLFGDGCGPNTLLMEDSSTTVSQYWTSLQKVKAMEDTYDHVLRNHGTFHSDKAILDRVLALCPLILEGRDARALLPEHMQKMFPTALPKPLPCYSARPLALSPDEPEGNINYRLDKAV